jgi:hypothetical protein
MHARFLGPAFAGLLALTAAGAMAQNTPPAGAAAAPAAPPVSAPTQLTRVRGTIDKVSDHELVVHARDGSTVHITLIDPLTVATLKRVPLRAIKDDTFVGIASRNGPNGTAEALEVLVFPPAMRGTGEGHYAWDLEPGSMMTNAPVTGVVKAGAGRTLTLTYKGGTFTVHVPRRTAVVTFAPATRADLKPGRQVFVIAHKDANGNLATPRVTVGTHGVNPPM